jgi:hypothetical protein
MNNLAHFKELDHLADKLIGELSKHQIAEAARLLALHVAHYAMRDGDIPHQNLLELVGVAELTEQQTGLLRDAMELLVGYLGVVRDMDKDDGDTTGAARG